MVIMMSRLLAQVDKIFLEDFLLPFVFILLSQEGIFLELLREVLIAIAGLTDG
jgi:hypothetical protein